jgi:hypothetical protein
LALNKALERGLKEAPTTEEECEMSQENELEELAEIVEQAESRSEAARTDVEAMQAELVELRRQVAEVEAIKSAQSYRGRRFAIAMLILLASLVAAVATFAFWMRGTIINSDRWASTVAPLSRNEVIVNTLTTYVVADVFEAIDAEQIARDVLPERVAFLSGPLTSALQGAVEDTVSTVVRSDQFNAVWVAVNRTAHRAIVGALLGNGDVLYIRGGQLTLDLSELFGSIQSLVGLDDLDLFAGKDVGKFVLLESRQVAAVQQVLGTLNAGGLILPFVALVLYFLAWLISLWRRKTLLWIGIGLASAMALVLILLAIAQPVVLASIVDPVIRALAGEIWRVILRGLIVQTILVGMVGLLIVLGTWLAGPNARAVAIRTGVRGWIRRAAE